MQKFVVKKISRSTNITISAEDQSLLQCSDQKPQMSEDLEISSVKMSGYLKKKRNRVGGWSKLYFVLQNSLLMSYNSREEYEKKLVSFKDVICLIPGNTVLLPSLEPRFTIASNLNTFYTFRCDDNRICSKWITAILECLSRDIDYEGNRKKSNNQVKNYSSQQNLSHRPRPMCQVNNHSWENLPNSNWIVNQNGRILMELNYLNCNNRAKLPIGAKTAQILQKHSDNDVITTTKKVNFIQHDENHNVVRNFDHNELRDVHDKNCDQFRLHNEEKSKSRQSKEVDRISKMFAQKSESQRPGSPTKCNGNDFSEIGIEEQMQAISFGDETGDYSSIYNDLSQQHHSVDSKVFNNKLNIEETYAEIDIKGNVKSNNEDFHKKTSTIKASDIAALPEYAVIDLNKKREARSKRSVASEIAELNDFARDEIYEDVGLDIEEKINNSEDKNIYELIDIPLRPSRKSRSLVWKNWSRVHLFDFTKRFKDGPENNLKPPSPETINKRQKASLTLSDFSKRFNYRSMRNKARKMCSRNNSAFVTNSHLPDFDGNSDKNVSSSDKTI